MKSCYPLATIGGCIKVGIPSHDHIVMNRSCKIKKKQHKNVNLDILNN